MPHIPLKQRIIQVRTRTEHLFGSHEWDHSLEASQRLDMLIYHVLLIRHGRFCVVDRRITARRKACRRRFYSSAAS